MTRKDIVRAAIARAFDVPTEPPDSPPDTDTADTADITPADMTAGMSAVRDLLAHWRTAGPPPLGTSINRWWDRRLVELATALATNHKEP